MKKALICIILILALLSSIVSVLAEMDFSEMSFNELLEAQEQLTTALWASDGWEEVRVPTGIYKIGEDIPAGRWTISITPDNKYYVTIYTGTELDETGNSVAYPYTYESIHREQGNTSVTWTLKDGCYFSVENGDVLFTTPTTNSLGFGKGKSQTDSEKETTSVATEEYEEKIETLQNQKDTLETQFSELKKYSSELEGQITNYEAQVAELTTKISTLEAQIEERLPKPESTPEPTPEPTPELTSEPIPTSTPIYDELAKSNTVT